MYGTCRNHPNYDGSKRPNQECLHCWLVWCHANPKTVITAKDLRRVLRHILTTQNIHHTWITTMRDFG